MVNHVSASSFLKTGAWWLKSLFMGCLRPSGRSFEFDVPDGPFEPDETLLAEHIPVNKLSADWQDASGFGYDLPTGDEADVLAEAYLDAIAASGIRVPARLDPSSGQRPEGAALLQSSNCSSVWLAQHGDLITVSQCYSIKRAVKLREKVARGKCTEMQIPTEQNILQGLRAAFKAAKASSLQRASCDGEAPVMSCLSGASYGLTSSPLSSSTSASTSAFMALSADGFGLPVYMEVRRCSRKRQPSGGPDREVVLVYRQQHHEQQATDCGRSGSSAGPCAQWLADNAQQQWWDHSPVVSTEAGLQLERPGV